MNRIIRKYWIMAAMLAAIPFFSEAQSWQWLRGGGSPNQALNGSVDDQGKVIQTDQWGNIYVAGEFMNGAVLSGIPLPGIAAGGFQNGFLAKYDCEGNIIWAKPLAGNLSCFVNDMVTDMNGNSYLFGMVGNTSFRFGDSVFTGNILSAYIAKFDSGGVFRWVKFTGLTGAGRNGGIDLDNTGNVVAAFTTLAGNFNGTVPVQQGGVIARYDTAGQFISVVQFSNIWSPSTIRDLRADSFGNVFICGFFIDSVTFQGTTIYSISTFSSGANSFIAKLNMAGNLVWVKTGLSINGVTFNKIAVSDQNHLFVGGGFGNKAYFNNDSATNISNSGQLFYTVYDTSGNVLFVRNTIGNSGANRFGSLDVDQSNLFLSGSFGGVMYFGSDSLSTTTPYNLFVSKSTQQGIVQKMSPLNGSGFNNTNTDIVTSITGDAYLTGYFQGSLYLSNDTLISAGGHTDIFIAKWGDSLCMPVSGIREGVGFPEIRLYPNPVRDILTVEAEDLKAPMHLRIIDLNGKTVKEEQVNTNRQEIDVKSLPAGMYIYRLSAGQSMKTGKIVRSD